MNSFGVALGRIHGIRILIHWSWAIIVPLVLWSLVGTLLPHYFPGWSIAEDWQLAAVAVLLLFSSVLMHELSHSVVAQRYGAKVDAITPYLFGGASDNTSEMRSPEQEFWIMLAGPLVSLASAFIFLCLYLFIPHPDWVGAILGYLGIVNGVLAAINLLPALPLDGGRILHALVWRMTGDQARALRFSTTVGSWLAWAIILIGLWQALIGDLPGGIWLMLIGWFLHKSSASAGPAARRDVDWSALTASQVMAPAAPVAPDMRLDRAVHEMLRRDERALSVSEGADFRGLLSVHDVRQVNPDSWSVTAAFAAMVPANQLASITSDTPLSDVASLFTACRQEALPVMQDTLLIGLVTSERLAGYVRLRHDLGLDEPWSIDHGTSSSQSTPASLPPRREAEVHA